MAIFWPSLKFSSTVSNQDETFTYFVWKNGLICLFAAKGAVAIWAFSISLPLQWGSRWLCRRFGMIMMSFGLIRKKTWHKSIITFQKKKSSKFPTENVWLIFLNLNFSNISRSYLAINFSSQSYMN